MKVAQLFKLYNFASRNIFKFYLHFEIWIWGAFEHLNHFKITPNFIWNLKNFEYQSCNTLGVWLLLIAFRLINMCIIYVIISIVTETYICNIRTFCLFRIGVLMNDSIATYECNINFSYLETWQHGRNMTSVE